VRYNSPIPAAERHYTVTRKKDNPVSTYYGEDTFNDIVMEEKLPKVVFDRFMDILQEDRELDLDTANAIAHAMKEWAIERGATHFAHWFQPMTGATAEKHDAFIEFEEGVLLERFSGKQLVQGEPDASSFPSGGIRATFEARGYTGWDMTSPAFLRHNGTGTTLCIPTVFISYNGEALDKKTPLLRSIRAVNESALRMLRVLGHEESCRVMSNLGPEQEYFLVDTDFFYRRPDLVLAGRTLLGAPPAKGQQLDDQYFGSIKERVQSFMHDVEEELYKLGIPAKTRHNEVAPSQFEIAPIFEEANIAVDHNLLVMDTIRQVSRRHHFAVLFNEKPFAGINGSGKHLNWSLSTDDGINLFDPGKTPEGNIQFLVFLMATLRAVHRHADLLRASIASAGNDHRLGANEAPPAIISIFLGEQLTSILQNIAKGDLSDSDATGIIDLGLSSLPKLSRDTSDRNRTSPFAFTGNKFEFRAVGSNHNISFPATVLNTIISQSLDELSDMLEASKEKDIRVKVLNMIREELPRVEAILFSGDNYSQEWQKEAEKRGLPNLRTTPMALKALTEKKAEELFEKYRVFSPVELDSRYHIKIERYSADKEIEVRVLLEMISTRVLPPALRFQGELAASLDRTLTVLGSESAVANQKDLLARITTAIENLCVARDNLFEKLGRGVAEEDIFEKAKYFCQEITQSMEDARLLSDELETLIDDNLWTLPKFWEMLYIS
jgi:glutamine synthetase